MRLKTCLSLAIALMVLGAAISAQAQKVHWFDCSVCHNTGVTTTSLAGNNVCISCHQPNPPSTTYLDSTGYKPHGVFVANDASNALGSATKISFSPSEQTSHYWASTKDVVPAAGALAATSALYRSRYGISNGKVTCTRCHDPHLEKDEVDADSSDNKLLRMDSTNAMCLNCHRSWNVSNADHGLGTHPMVVDYPTFAAANSDKYKSVTYNATSLVLDTNTDKGSVRLLYNSTSSKYDISCSSCHGVHFTDSNSSTDDGVGQSQTTNTGYTTGLATGDGKLLLGDGPGRTDADSATQAQLRSNICQTCHIYKTHGDVNLNDNSMFAGCLDCHGGHVYHATKPNYFVLRKSVDDIFVPKDGEVGDAAGLEFTTTTANWADASGTGYCQGCHSLTFPHNGKVSGSYGKSGCVNCHFHNNDNGSFVADCSACHGFPPTLNSEGNDSLGGYAIDVDNNRSYRYTDIGGTVARDEFKDETQTPHKRHAAGGSDYSLACDNCHSEAFTGAETHLDGDFQNVDFGSLAGGSAGYSNFSGTASGTCSSVYCHSNGNVDDPVYSSVDWKDTAGTITGCAACHGNTATSMNASNMKNSTSHLAHLGQGGMGKSYGCEVCHAATVSDASSLLDSAKLLGGVHVNGQPDIDFVASGGVLYNALSTGSFTDGSNTCATVYCHSDGKGNYSAPDWDDDTSGACGTCHNATPSSGSHTVHLNATGANIGCASCHGDGANTGAHSGHIDAAISLTSGVCDSCHAVDVTDGSSTPTWGDADTAVCDACHAGTSTTSYTDASSVLRTAPAKSNFFSAGHGKTVANGGSNAPDTGCTGCHDTATDTAHMDSTADNTDRLKTVNSQTYATATPNAFCGACHDSGSANEHEHYTTTGTSDDGSLCNYCHDPHGGAGYDAMLLDTIQGTAIASFADKTARASYASASNNGVCQVCHSSDVRRFNQSTYSASHGGTDNNCLECHPHTADPAFKPVCYACHGGGTTVGTEQSYWPDSSTSADENTAGKHAIHMEKLSMAVYSEQYNTTLLTTTSNGTAEDKQRALCEYCHAAVTNDYDHTATGAAEVFVATLDGSTQTRFAKAIWWDPASLPTQVPVYDLNASYNATDDTCSNVACHNNKLTADGTYGWYDAGTSNCVMCHTDVPSDSKSHTVHTGAIWGITCSECHQGSPAWPDSDSANQVAPSTGHMDGSYTIAGGSRTFTYSGGSCGTNECHNDGNMNAPDVSYDWSTGATTTFCDACHDLFPDSNGHNQHYATSTVIGGPSSWCTDCHTHASPQGTGHLDGTINFIDGITYSGDLSISDGITIEGDEYGECSTQICHQDGRGNAVETPAWNRTASSTDNCTICHGSTNNGIPLSTTPATQGSHGVHVTAQPTQYNSVAVNSTEDAYQFACSNCHTMALSSHLNSSDWSSPTVDLSLNNTDGGTLKSQNDAADDASGYVQTQGSSVTCSAAYCHSYVDADGARQFATTPDWYSTGFSVDACSGCHGNSPVSNAHEVHEVGIHFDTTYTGDTGLQTAGSTGDNAHGSATTSTVIGCLSCHNDTVKAWYNDKNTTCASCHDGVTAVEQGSLEEASETDDTSNFKKTTHVNGSVDVAFQNIAPKTRAQIRNGIENVPELYDNWERQNDGILDWLLFYKNTDDYDQATSSLNSATFSGGTCSAVACHNGYDIEWTKAKTSYSCDACHTQLP